MINNMTINGVIYELIDNPNKLDVPCEQCDIISFCRLHQEFIIVCHSTNSNNYYKTIKQ